MGVNSLPKTVTRQRSGCDLNPGPSARESSTLTTRLPSHPSSVYVQYILFYNYHAAVRACVCASPSRVRYCYRGDVHSDGVGTVA